VVRRRPNLTPMTALFKDSDVPINIVRTFTSTWKSEALADTTKHSHGYQRELKSGLLSASVSP